MPSFLPFVRRWFDATFTEATRPQREGWDAIASGRDTLIVAPTGSGKTLAAFLWTLDYLHRLAADGRLEDRVYVVYVSPLRALNNDIEKHPRRRCRSGPPPARGPRGREDGRHARRRPSGDDPPATPRLDHHAGIALHPPHGRALPPGAGEDALRDRRRDPRDDGQQARGPL